MELSICGQPQAPIIALIGTYDPLMQDHIDLAATLAGSCAMRGLVAALVMITPSPSELFNPDQKIPIQMDMPARLDLLRSVGIGSIIMANFCREDLDRNAFQFLNDLRRHAPLAGVWLGATQTLGSGPLGTSRAVAEYTKAAGIEYQVVAYDPELKTRALSARTCLATGDIVGVKHFTGLWPTLRLESGRSGARMWWHPGLYAACAKDDGSVRGQIRIGEDGFASGLGQLQEYTGLVMVSA